jgi:hypothetical protein
MMVFKVINHIIHTWQPLVLGNQVEADIYVDYIVLEVDESGAAEPEAECVILSSELASDSMVMAHWRELEWRVRSYTTHPSGLPEIEAIPISRTLSPDLIHRSNG